MNEYSLIMGSLTSGMVYSGLLNLREIQFKSYRHSFLEVSRNIPYQILMKRLQMEVAKETAEPCGTFVSFGLVGLTQGMIYNQAVCQFKGIYLKQRNLFRGCVVGSFRDMISQGIPYVFNKNDFIESKYCKFISTLGLSVICTFGSHIFHNIQITMQSHPHLNYRRSLIYLRNVHGFRSFYSGVSSRLLLLGITNVLNVFLLDNVF